MPAGTCCYCCGKNHASKCRFATAICRACGKMGHIARACQTRWREAQTQRRPELSTYDEEQGNPSSKTEGSQESNVYALFHMKIKRDEPLTVNVDASGAKLMMEVDTWAAVSVISEQTYKHSWPSGSRPRLQNTSLQLWSYLGDKLSVIGQISVKVCYNKQEECIDLVAIAGKGLTLMGRSWLERLDDLGQTDPASCHIHTICNPVGLKQV